MIQLYVNELLIFFLDLFAAYKTGKLLVRHRGKNYRYCAKSKQACEDAKFIASSTNILNDLKWITKNDTLVADVNVSKCFEITCDYQSIKGTKN